MWSVDKIKDQITRERPSQYQLEDTLKCHSRLKAKQWWAVVKKLWLAACPFTNSKLEQPSPACKCVFQVILYIHDLIRSPQKMSSVAEQTSYCITFGETRIWTMNLQQQVQNVTNKKIRSRRKSLSLFS